MNGFNLIYSLKLLPGIVLGLTIHEFSHAFIAQKCGDNTSSEQGRVTLNPFKHIDPFGFIMLFAVGFGWAKPVQFNEQNLRNPQSDIIKIAVAGPLSNALLAMILSLVLASLGESIGRYSIIREIFIYAIFINWGLFIFNLIPLPPLDGSHILFSPLKKHQKLYEVLYKYGTWILFGLVLVSIVTKKNLLPIGPVIDFCCRGFLGLFGYQL
jgi:Zn-dependent protease